VRSGRLVMQVEGYRAFIPAPLPPVPPVAMGDEMAALLSDADRDLGRLDGIATVLPNPDLFVAMYVRHEAVLSSQIEGTQSTLEDVLAYEAGVRGETRPKDVGEVVNYVHAMNYGLERRSSLPLSLRLLREIHGHLMKGVRGGHLTPGEFRKSQNWVGPAGCTLREATFVPPPPHELAAALGDLEKFLHDRRLPVLVHCGLAHAQFETIHPFPDGNGRVGRLLITLLLCEREVLRLPLLYLSHYLKLHRTEYYDRLSAIRMDGDWEGWILFFLRGVSEVAREATETARAIVHLREVHRGRLLGQANGARLLDFLFEHPLVSIRMVEAEVGCSYLTAARLVGRLEKEGILLEITGGRRNRLFRYEPYYRLFEKRGPGAGSRRGP
jgi:Fic family protein